MSQKPKSILKNKEYPKSMDFAFLKREGIEMLQKLSGKIWTDYNLHDPGITILENLCFALTELGYKTNFNIEDLFFQKDIENRSFLETFFEAADILPPSPTTIFDYRKVLIDHVSNLKNAWLVPMKQSTLGTKIDGLYEVLILAKENANPLELVDEVKKVMTANRNIGEDVENIRVLEPEPIIIQANINITANSIGEDTIAKILSNVSELIAPTIPLYNIDELRDRAYTYEEIFSMPVPKNGFVLDEDLEKSSFANSNKIFKSDIIRIITEIEGVEEVTNLSLIINGEVVHKELIQFDNYKIPRLNIEHIIEQKTISLFAGNILYSTDNDVVNYTLDSLRSKEGQNHRRYLDLEIADYSSSIDKAELEEYTTIQNSFPKTYGITDYGIEGEITDARKAQVKQLKAYLFVFEQIMANHLSQLVNIDKLFSANGVLEESYFHQNLDYVKGFSEVAKNGTEEFKKALSGLIKKYDNVNDRQNRFLNHMLARFGEEFLSEAYTAIHRESSDFVKKSFAEKSIIAKNKYLLNYAQLSANRAKGYNYLQNYAEAENISVLEKKVSLLFNINNYGYKKLSEIENLKNIEQSSNTSTKQKGVTSSDFNFASKQKNLLTEILGYGVERHNYTIEKEGKDFVVYFENPESKEKFPIHKNKSVPDCESNLSKLIKKLLDINLASEGFHMVEHILLRQIDAKYRFNYISKNNQTLKSEFVYTDPHGDRKTFVENLVKTAKLKKNYSVSKMKDNSYKLTIKNGTQVFAYDDSYVLKKSAEEAISMYIKEIEKLKLDDPDLKYALQFEQDMRMVKTYNDDPFSMQASFILPLWSGRFNSNMRFLFEQIVKLNAPAYLKINYLWLSIEEMKAFEDVYEKWLIEKNKEVPEQPKLDSLSSYLLFYIQNHISTDAKKDHYMQKLEEAKKLI